MTSDFVGVPAWTARRGPWFLAALHVPFATIGAVITIGRHDYGLVGAELIVAICVAIGALQLRHCLAAVRGVRPRGRYLTLLALCLLVYLPLPVLTWNWFEMQDFVVASVLMILPRRTGLVLAAGVLIGQTVASGLYVTSGRDPAAFQAVFTLYTLTLLAMGGAALVGSGWLARTLADLDKAQREQADLAVTRERVRLSRDLHDLLGQSLATASLKGDLALSMLAADPAAAKAELEGLAVAARSALIDLRAVTQDKHAVTLRAEIASAVALLGAAGIHTAVEVADYALARPVEEAMAWAVREAATNTLRHSQATRWSVTARQAAGRVRLTIINDGAQPDGGGQPGGAQAAGRPDGQPSGLSGVAARARALSGNATIRHTSDGQFRLAVEIPLEPS